MPERAYDLHGVRILELATEGPQLRSDRDAVEVISAALSHEARFLLIPAQRLADDFFHLKTRLAGEMLHRFSIYRFRVAIAGDISRHLEASDTFRDFVYEANRGSQVWFVADAGELETRLKAGHQA
jgi:hypothetical protein